MAHSILVLMFANIKYIFKEGYNPRTESPKVTERKIYEKSTIPQIVLSTFIPFDNFTI